MTCRACLPRPAPTLRPGPLSPLGALKVSDRPGEPPRRPHQREHGTLRVLTACDPDAGKLERTFKDPSTAGLHPLNCRINVADTEIKEPERQLHHLGFVGDPAESLAGNRHDLVAA